MGAFRIFRRLQDLLDVNPAGLADNDVPTWDAATSKFTMEAGGGGGGGAPTNADYLVGTADATLSNEIVVGATPGGELGNTWASPTVDTVHSGSSHAATQAAAEAASVILAPASSARNVIQPTAGAVIAAIVKAHAAQSVDLTQWQTSAGVPLVQVGPTGAVTISPSDPELDTLVTIQAPVGFLNTSGDGQIFAIFGEDGTCVYEFSTWGDLAVTPLLGNEPAAVQIWNLAHDGKTSMAGPTGDPNSAVFDCIPSPGIATTFQVTEAGHFKTAAHAAPSDGSLLAGYLAQWYDQTDGAAKFMLKGKTADGTVVTWAIPNGVVYVAGGTDVAVADGGTGASTAAGARTNLGVIAANVPFTPAGTIAATDVQAAIEEVASEAGGGGAPTTAPYITTAADAGLSAEVVLGTGVIMSGTLAARPAASIAGRLYFATDVNGGTLYRDTGAAWVQVSEGLNGSEPPAFVGYGGHPHLALAGGIGTLTTGSRAQGQRVIIPKTGTLNEVYIYVGTVSSGNIEVGILDTTATTRNRLWTSGSIACPAANGFRKIGDPALAVVEGDQLDFYVNADNATANFTRTLTFQTSATTILPTVFFTSPLGGKPALVWQGPAATFPLGATLAEASMTSGVLTAPSVIAVVA